MMTPLKKRESSFSGGVGGRRNRNGLGVGVEAFIVLSGLEEQWLVLKQKQTKNPCIRNELIFLEDS